MPIAVRIARDRSRLGFRASPASWTACSKPCNPNTTPPVSAANTPWKPNGMKPPSPAVKFAGLNCVPATTTTARNGTSVFQITTNALLSDMNFAPARLIAVNTIIRPIATTRPRPLSSPALSSMLKCACAVSVLLMYVIAASTSIGAMNTAWSHAAQPAVKPAIGPWL